MRPALPKAFGWIGLAVGGGGTLLGVSWSAIEGWEDWPDGILGWLLLWLIGAPLLTVVCAWILKRAYRREPAPGRNQLVLADLVYALLLFASVLFIGSQAEEGMALLKIWLMPALLIACSYLAGGTHAARLGLRGWRRYTRGAATALIIMGGLGGGALIVFYGVLAGIGGIGASAMLFRDILDTTVAAFPKWMIYTYRISLCIFPLGLLLRVVLHLSSSDREAATGATGSGGV